MSNEGLLLFPSDTDYPLSAYSSWAATASAVTATPTASLQANGWASDDVVRVSEINGAMKTAQNWFQFLTDAGLQSSGGISRAEYFGTGVDGSVTISAPTTLTRDMFYSDLVIDAGGYINTAGYRIYAGSIDLTTAVAGAIRFNGNNGQDAVDFSPNTTAGLGGTAVLGNFASVSGANGGRSVLDAGDWTLPTLSTDARMYFASYSDILPRRKGGDGGGIFPNVAGGNEGHVGSVGSNDYNGELAYQPLTEPSTSVLRTKRIGGGLGGGGGGAGRAPKDGSAAGGGGGGGGASGGFIFVAARYITIDTAQPAGTIQAKGGDGGDSCPSVDFTGGSGGGGGGGSGGTVVVLCEAVYTNAGIDTLSTGIADVIDVSGGLGGTGVMATGAAGYAGNGGDGGNGGVVLVVRTAIDPDNTLGINRVTWAPATTAGADGVRADYGAYSSAANVGGAGGVWKVAL